jgi:sterol desaturase/sphingolipid hydroxylase (fatty acid hydroxylase superfamily)
MAPVATSPTHHTIPQVNTDDNTAFLLSMQISLIVGLTALAMFVIELIQPGRRWPQVAGWWSRAALLNGVQVASVFVTGILWDRHLNGQGIWSLENTSPYFQITAGYLVITFIYYWWHRWRHDVGFLWRWFHQVHHSPQRLEIITSFYKHPNEILFNGFLSSAILYLLCGVSPEAASATVLITGLAELFYHWNVKTPRWIGYIFQRPESHCIHHQLGHHRQNYSDLPIWDMLFGTFHNPKEWKEACGFDQARERELGTMLLGKDVTISRAES